MSSQAKRAIVRAVRVRAQHRSVERQLGRFRPELRASVRGLAARHERLAQLSLSFPALLVALVWPRREIDTQVLVDMAISGAPLAELAIRARVPMWLRRIPTEMLVGPMPKLPDSFFLRRRIVNHFPTSPKLAPRWFANLSFAGRWSDEAFAL